MTTLREMARRAVEDATRRGFQPAEWSILPTKTMWIITELDELVAAAEDEGDVGSEIADVALRTMGILHVMFPEWEIEADLQIVPRPIMSSLETELWQLVRFTSKAAQAWRRGHVAIIRQNLERLLEQCFRLASRLGFGLVTELERKLTLNAARPHLHGTLEALG